VVRSASPLAALLLIFGCSLSPGVDVGEPVARIRWERAGSHALSVDGERIGQLAPLGSGWRLVGGAEEVELRVSQTPQGELHAYPMRVTSTALRDGRPAFEEGYTLLAPAAPLPVEGYGLVVSSDEPGTNDVEHQALRDWLAEQGLPASTRIFQELHERETGRALRVWYEISGRRSDWRFARAGADETLARVDPLFRSEGDGLKIHHKRPGENGRFTYHRESLERASALRSDDGPALVSHECGCYGYAIAADYMTLGDFVYHVAADWLDDRVGAEFFVGFELRQSFPWVGLGDRRRMRDLARRARAWELTDADGRLFAEVALDLPDDPPPAGLGPIGYRVDLIDADGKRRPLARARREHTGLDLALHGPDAQQAIDTIDSLLAAMPTQVERGDGLRDSHLDEIERVVDAARLLRHFDEARLADFASPLDVWTAREKVRTLLARAPERFAASESALPPPPIAGPGRRSD
jgi:hypothetical protein